MVIRDFKIVVILVLIWYYCANECLSEKGVIFGAPLTEEGIAQIYQLIEYLSKSKYNFIHMYDFCHPSSSL